MSLWPYLSTMMDIFILLRLKNVAFIRKNSPTSTPHLHNLRHNKNLLPNFHHPPAYHGNPTQTKGVHRIGISTTCKRIASVQQFQPVGVGADFGQRWTMFNFGSLGKRGGKIYGRAGSRC